MRIKLTIHLTLMGQLLKKCLILFGQATVKKMRMAKYPQWEIR